MEKLRVGIIGTGGISHLHMDGYKLLEKEGIVEVVAVCDINKKKVERYAEKYNVKNYYYDLNEMLAKEKLDCVSVCTWNAAHKIATVAALNAGCNVICEKPMAMNSAEAQEMIDAAEKAGKILQIGFVRRFGNDADIVNRYIASGNMGDIYYAKATYLRRDGCPGGWFGDKSYSGGGPLIDLGVHVIDLVRYLAGSPKPIAVYGVTYNNLGCGRASGFQEAWTAPESDLVFKYTVEDFVSAMIKFDSGLTLQVEASFNLNLKSDTGRIELFGTKSGAAIDPGIEFFSDIAGSYVNITPAGDSALSFDGLFEREIKGFVDCVLGKRECVATGYDGLAVMNIIDAIYESARENKLVYIK